MNKKEIKSRIPALLAAGAEKSVVFAKLSGQGVTDAQLALLIASHPDPDRCTQHRGKVRVLIVIMLFQALIAFAAGFGASSGGPGVRLGIAMLGASLPLLLAFGFHRSLVWAYNVYIMLGIVQLPQAIIDLASGPPARTMVFAVNLAVLGYVWYVRKRIFPDLIFFAPRKVKGEYVFSR